MIQKKKGTRQSSSGLTGIKMAPKRSPNQRVKPTFPAAGASVNAAYPYTFGLVQIYTIRETHV